MNVLIILGHPDKKSFNHAIAQTCISQIKANGHSVFFHDLYAENFNPLLQLDNEYTETVIDNQIKAHCNDLINSDGIIVIHPIWWGQPPAIIKGWLDRVFLPGVAYKFVDNDKGKHIPDGLLKAKSAIILNSSNTPDDLENNPLDSIWKNRVFMVCGVNQVERRNFCVVKDSDDSQRNQWLEEVQLMMDTYFPKK
jgi:NAD(P)H dehydrogenase (quinone)